MPTLPAELTYAGASLTEPARDVWSANPPAFRRFERTIVVGHGNAVWIFATAEVMKWGIKRRSGFDVTPAGVADEGVDFCITARWGPSSCASRYESSLSSTTTIVAVSRTARDSDTPSVAKRHSSCTETLPAQYF